MSDKPRLDQFYTNSDIAQWCLDKLNLNEYDILLEPSAGSGAFFNLLPTDRREGLDLEPATSGVKKMDYFDFEYVPDKKYLTVGNPPFGKNSSLAKKFFNKSAEFSETIAFILPRTFRKTSTINQLNRWFHLAEEHTLPKDSFHLPDGTLYDVPCVFQVWKRATIEREKIPLVTTCEDFKFIPIGKNGKGKPTDLHKITQRTAADFCVRRVGAGAGNVYEDFNETERDWKSHYYIKEGKPGVKDTMSQIVWDDSSGKYDTAGNPSISKDELIRNYCKTLKRIEK